MRVRRSPSWFVMSASTEKSPRAKPKLQCRAHGAFNEWLAESGGSLAITTYTSGKLVLVSSFDGKLQYCTKRFTRPMGIALEGDRMALAVREQILLFRAIQDDSSCYELLNRYHTGKVDAHDVAFGQRGIYFANTRFNAIARVSKQKRFVHCWQPSFIDGVVKGDRCHLNGLGMREGAPKVATAFCATGAKGGWREEDRFTGGILLDVNNDEILTRGLCMPHSPRWFADRWWLCNSGHGTLAVFDEQSGRCTEVCALPGFTRGLCFVGNHALLGLSRIRRKHILDAPPVRARHKTLTAGIALVDWQAGRQVGGLEFVTGGNEVYEVLFLPHVRKPELRRSSRKAKDLA